MEAARGMLKQPKSKSDTDRLLMKIAVVFLTWWWWWWWWWWWLWLSWWLWWVVKHVTDGGGDGDWKRRTSRLYSWWWWKCYWWWWRWCRNVLLVLALTCHGCAGRRTSVALQSLQNWQKLNRRLSCPNLIFSEPVRRETPPWQKQERLRCSQGLEELESGNDEAVVWWNQW